MGFLNKLFYSFHPFPPNTPPTQASHPSTSATSQVQTSAPSAYGRYTETKSISFFSVSSPKMRSGLTEKYPFFLYSYELCSASDRTVSFQQQGSRAVLLSQHTCAKNCSHPLPSPCTPLSHAGLPCSQHAACKTGAQKDSFIFHIFMPCRGNHGRQKLKRKGKRQYMKLLPD